MCNEVTNRERRMPLELVSSLAPRSKKSYPGKWDCSGLLISEKLVIEFEGLNDKIKGAGKS